jgi:hypothetical protein
VSSLPGQSAGMGIFGRPPNRGVRPGWGMGETAPGGCQRTAALLVWLHGFDPQPVQALPVAIEEGQDESLAGLFPTQQRAEALRRL